MRAVRSGTPIATINCDMEITMAGQYTTAQQHAEHNLDTSRHTVRAKATDSDNNNNNNDPIIPTAKYNI
jgi:hypothetical protein